VECGSVILEKWFYMVVPVVRLGYYRVIRIGRKSMGGEFIGRRVKEPVR